MAVLNMRLDDSTKDVLDAIHGNMSAGAREALGWYVRAHLLAQHSGLPVALVSLLLSMGDDVLADADARRDLDTAADVMTWQTHCALIFSDVRTGQETEGTVLTRLPESVKRRALALVGALDDER